MIIDPKDSTTYPDGLRITCSYDASWTYVHYKGITRAVYPREDGTFSIGKPDSYPTYVDVECETGFPDADIAVARAIEILTGAFVEI